MSVIRFFCSLCNRVVKNGETHQCAFRKEDESENKSRPVKTEELDGKKGDEKTEEYGGNSQKRIGNTSKAAPLAEYSSQASTSRAAGNRDVPEGSSDEPLDLTNRPVPTQPSLHGANSEREAEKKPTELEQDVGAVAGPSTIRHHSTGPGGEIQYACVSCNFRSKYKGNFLRHQRRHSGLKPFMCETCGKGFTRNEHLIRHMRTHTGEKHFICNICGKGFTQRENLHMHKLVHMSEKPFVCNTCGNGFTRKDRLDKHARTHI